VKRFLIVKLSSLGDVLHTFPFVAACRRSFPDARLVWVVQPEFSGLIPGPPWVDEVIEFNRPSLRHPIRTLRELVRLRHRLRAEKFDLAIDLQGLFKSTLVMILSGTKRRVGTALMREGSGWVSRPVRGEHKNGHAVERSLDVARFLGMQADPLEYPFPDLAEPWQKVQEKLQLSGSAKEKPYIVFVPGTRWETKCWPPEHFARLAGLFGANQQIIIAGGAGDKDRSRKILDGVSVLPAENRPKFIDLTGKTSLLELAALLRHASLFVGADTGPLHIAAAAQIPLVTCFGPTLPDRTGPYGTPCAVVLTAPSQCAGCLKRHCSNWHCMKSIPPEQVFDACQNLLTNPCDLQDLRN